MKVYVSVDMEGTAGVVDWSQCRPDGPDYRHFAGLVTAEVNAAIEGAMAAGATEFLVNDAHGRMANHLPDALAGDARYLSGRFKPLYMMQGLDPSYDAVFFLSYHGSMGSAGSTLSHTYFPGAIAEVRLNSQVVGESGLNALVALAHDVPVVLVTGDDVTAAEARVVAPGIHTAVVKHSVSRFAADSMHPRAACAVIRAAAETALTELASATPPDIALPATLELRFTTSDYAELAEMVAGMRRTGPASCELSGADPLALYRAFVTVVLLCRGLVE